jgi:hypothetical protein
MHTQEVVRAYTHTMMVSAYTCTRIHAHAYTQEVVRADTQIIAHTAPKP